MAAYIVKRGATFTRLFQWLEDGQPIDLTGCTGVSAFGHPGGTAAAGTLTLSIVTAAEGKFKIEAVPAVTQTWPIGKYALDIVIQFPDGRKIATESIDFTIEGSPALG